MSLKKMLSFELDLELTSESGSIAHESVLADDADELSLKERRLVAVSDNVALMTRVKRLTLYGNAFTTVPPCMMAMTQLVVLNFHSNRLAALPPAIGHMRLLKELYLSNNRLVTLPREVGELRALEWLLLSNNALRALPPELSKLQALEQLWLQSNRLFWLPRSLNRLPLRLVLHLDDNPIVGSSGDVWATSRDALCDLLAATTFLEAIRDHATTLAIGLQDLELPALVTLEIIDAAFPNSIPMHLKWKLITTVKHWNGM